MLCDKCKKNNATFFSSVNINGNITETHLCENCAKENKLFSFNNFLAPSFDAFDFFNNFLAPSFDAFDFLHDEDELVCDNCGYTLSDFKDSGMLGCSNCYKVFRDIILNNLSKIQPALTHKGKKPDVSEGLTENEKEIKKLEVQLKQAVNEENYELAGELKKKIIALKEGDKHE